MNNYDSTSANIPKIQKVVNQLQKTQPKEVRKQSNHFLFAKKQLQKNTSDAGALHSRNKEGMTSYDITCNYADLMEDCYQKYLEYRKKNEDNGHSSPTTKSLDDRFIADNAELVTGFAEKIVAPNRDAKIRLFCGHAGLENDISNMQNDIFKIIVIRYARVAARAAELVTRVGHLSTCVGDQAVDHYLQRVQTKILKSEPVNDVQRYLQWFRQNLWQEEFNSSYFIHKLLNHRDQNGSSIFHLIVSCFSPGNKEEKVVNILTDEHNKQTYSHKKNSIAIKMLSEFISWFESYAKIISSSEAIGRFWSDQKNVEAIVHLVKLYTLKHFDTDGGKDNIRLFIKANCAVTDDQGVNVLMHFIANCSADYENHNEILLFFSPSLIGAKDKAGNNLLHYCCARGLQLSSAAEYLAKNYPTLLTVKNSKGHLPVNLLSLYPLYHKLVSLKVDPDPKKLKLVDKFSGFHKQMFESTWNQLKKDVALSVIVGNDYIENYWGWLSLSLGHKKKASEFIKHLKQLKQDNSNSKSLFWIVKNVVHIPCLCTENEKSQIREELESNEEYRKAAAKVCVSECHQLLQDSNKPPDKLSLLKVSCVGMITVFFVCAAVVSYIQDFVPIHVIMISASTVIALLGVAIILLMMTDSKDGSNHQVEQFQKSISVLRSPG